jgi:DNA topoisomerase IB
VSKDLSLPGLPRNKVLAAIVQLLELSFIRVGNEEYARENKSFGLTTMQDRHVDVKGSKMRRRFYRQRFSDLGGAVLAAIALNAVGEFETKKQAKANIKNAVIAVAKTLRNTPAICRKCYVHPAVFENYLAGNSIEGLKRETDEALGNKDVDLRSGEVAILKFLQARLARKAA